MIKRIVLLLWAFAVVCPAYAVTDTVTFIPGGGEADAHALEMLAWASGEFEVDLQPGDGDADAVLTFITAKPTGHEPLDTVRLRWFKPDVPLQQAAGASVPSAPAVLVVHSLHPDMPVGLGLCRGLRARGIHAFLLELPGYGKRRSKRRKMTGITALLQAPMAVADARRAFDVIADRPEIDADRISIQGTSLGSYFSVAAAGLDGCFANTFLLLSGGDGVGILERGQKDAYHVRRALKHYGYEGEKLRALIDPVEPLRLAPRLDATRTWMVNAVNDTVVPRENAQALADAMGLEPAHHAWVMGNHYTSFLMLPAVLDQMVREVTVVTPRGMVEAAP
ncbi:MAG: hypothetical protein V3V20_08225 [Algisphaera sp.]